MTADELEDFGQKVDAGIKAGARQALEEHRRMNRAVVIWRDGKSVWLSPEELGREMEQAESGRAANPGQSVG